MERKRVWIGKNVLCLLAACAFLGGVSCRSSSQTQENQETQDWTIHSLGFSGKNVLALAVDPQNPMNLYAAVKGEGCYRTRDGGRSWELPSPGPEPSNYGDNQLLVDPQNPDVLYWLRAGRTLKSFDRGSSWSVIYHTQIVKCLAVDPLNSKILYLHEVAHIIKSLDGGVNWLRIHSFGHYRGDSFSIISFAFEPKNGSVLYINYSGAGGESSFWYFEGIARSEDGGATWQHIYERELTYENNYAHFLSSNLALHPGDSSILYAGGDNGIVKSTDGGRTWITLVGSPAARSLAISPQRPEVIYAGGQGLYRGLLDRTDGGFSWELLGLSGKTVSQVVADPRNPLNVFIATDEGLFALAPPGAG